MGWSGTYGRWIRNLDFIESLAPEVIVPGHGPLCGLEGPREMKAYLQYMYAESRRCFDQGLNEMEAARRIDIGPYDTWHTPARLYFNVARATAVSRRTARRPVGHPKCSPACTGGQIAGLKSSSRMRCAAGNRSATC
jgi:hypothetical protein